MAGDFAYEWRQLAGEMEIRLAAGILLSRDTRQFMASTFSIENPPELQVLLDSPDDSEAQSLLELLFTPGESIRVALEEITVVFEILADLFVVEFCCHRACRRDPCLLLIAG